LIRKEGTLLFDKRRPTSSDIWPKNSKAATFPISSLRKNLGIGALTVLFASGFGAVGML
jgi:hypothetical protein